jgi:histone H3/H4
MVRSLRSGRKYSDIPTRAVAPVTSPKKKTRAFTSAFASGNAANRLSKADIMRLAIAGGLTIGAKQTKLSGDVYREGRSVTKQFLKKVLKDAVILTEHARRKTVSSTDIIETLKAQGRWYNLLWTEGMKITKCPLTGTIKFQRRRIARHIEKASGCVYFASTPFRALVRQVIAGVGKDPLRISGDACDVLQLATESYVTKVFGNSHHQANHAKRVTIKKKDIKIARQMRGEHRW